MARLTAKKFISVVVIVAAFSFLGKILVQNWRQVNTADLVFEHWYLIVSYALIVGSFLLSFQIWRFILRFLREDVTYIESLKITSIGRVVKYVPGKIFGPLERVHLAKNVGVSYKCGIISVAIEDILNILAGLLVFFISLPFWNSGSIPASYRRHLLPLIPGLLIFLHPSIWGRCVNFIFRRLRRPSIYIKIAYWRLLLLLLFSLTVRFIHGLGFYFLIKSFYHTTVMSTMPIIGGYAVSCVIGLLVFILPGGLGAKEGALSFLLSFNLPFSVAVMAALLGRIWLISVEVGFFSYSIRKIKL